MDSLQKKIIIAATVPFVAMGLFPPWRAVVSRGTYSVGCSFIASPPRPTSQVDSSRPIIQWVIVGISAGVAIGLAKREKS
jgi:hypothetical protein